MLRIELRRPIIPPRSITLADNETSPCSPRLPDRLIRSRPHLSPRLFFPSFPLLPSFSPAACCLHTGSSVNRLFTGFEGVWCFDLSGFASVFVCVGAGGSCSLQVPEDNCITEKGRHFKYARTDKKKKSLRRPLVRKRIAATVTVLAMSS